MGLKHKERKQYLKEIDELLVCNAKERKNFMIDFNNNIDEFVNSNPDADIGELKKTMGTPQEIAEEFMVNASPKEIKKRISFVRALIIGIAIIVIIVIISFITIFVDAHRASHGHFEYTIIDNGTVYEDDTIVDDGVIYDYGEISDNTLEVSERDQ